MILHISNFLFGTMFINYPRYISAFWFCKLFNYCLHRYICNELVSANTFPQLIYCSSSIANKVIVKYLVFIRDQFRPIYRVKRLLDLRITNIKGEWSTHLFLKRTVGVFPLSLSNANKLIPFLKIEAVCTHSCRCCITSLLTINCIL